MPTTDSPLRYPGGKTKIYQTVSNLFELNNLQGCTYVEPFAGGSGLALKLLFNGDVDHIVINDFDPAIYAFWHTVLYNNYELCEFIKNVPLNIEEWTRQKNNYVNSENVLQLGLATFYLNRTNRSGIIKGGPIGGKNQIGKYLLDARFSRNKLVQKVTKIYEYRDQISLFNLDAVDLIIGEYLNIYNNVFVNFDPPYVTKGNQLYKNSFNEADHKRLGEVIATYRNSWIVTYDVCPLIKEIYADFRQNFLDINYCVGTKRYAKEYIFFSDDLIVE